MPDTTPLVDVSSGKSESKGKDKSRASGSKSKPSKKAGERKETINVEKEKERKKRGGGVEAGPTQTEDDWVRAGADWLSAGGRDVTRHVRLSTLSPINAHLRL